MTTRHAPPRPPAATLARHEATRREVRRGMVTMLDALLDHVAELERRVIELERREREAAGDDCVLT